jgi:hypothetical protein
LPAAFWSLAPSGAFSINAATLQPSRHQIRYRLTEADGDTADAIIEVVILERNPIVPVAPLAAIDDRIGIEPGKKLVVAAPGILINDLGVRPFVAVNVTAGSLPASRVTVRADGRVALDAVGLAEGTYTFAYSIRNPAGVTSQPALVTVIVDNHNTCPVPVADLYRVRAGTFFDTGIPGALVNDFDREGQVASLAVIGGNASGGTAFSNAGFTVYRNGRVTLDARQLSDPAPGNQFIRQVTYRPIDDLGESCQPNTATIRIEIFGNAAPVAVPNFYVPGNSYYVHAGGVLSFPARGILGNDTDPDDPRTSLTARLVSKDFAAGSLNLGADGSFRLQAPSATTAPPGSTLRFRYQAVDPHGARSNIATVTITVVAGPSPVVSAPVATPTPPPPPPPGSVVPAGASSTHRVHAEDRFYLNEEDGLLSTATDGDHQTLRIDVVSVSDDRIAIDPSGLVSFRTELEDAGKRFTARYRVVDFDGLQSPVYTLTITVLTPRERCTTVNQSTDAEIETPIGSTGLLNASAPFRYCWNKLVVTSGGFIDDSGDWLAGSPASLVIDDGDTVSVDTGPVGAIYEGVFGEIASIIEFSGRAQGGPVVSAVGASSSYTSNTSWGLCFNPQSLLDFIPYAKAFKVLKKADPQLQDMFNDVAGMAVDAALAKLRTNSKWSSSLHQSLIEIIDVDSTLGKFLDSVAGTSVTIQYTDGTVAQVALWELAMLFAPGFAIAGLLLVDCIDLPASWGFGRSEALVYTRGTPTGAVDVVSDSYKDGMLSYLEVSKWGVDISKVKWHTSVSVSDPDIVGLDLSTSSPLP